jgi:hypothetical protein
MQITITDLISNMVFLSLESLGVETVMATTPNTLLLAARASFTVFSIFLKDNFPTGPE